MEHTRYPKRTTRCHNPTSRHDGLNMQEDLEFRMLVAILFVCARFVRWHVRHQIGWKASWPAMKQHPLDTALLIGLSICWLSAVVLYVGAAQLVATFALPIFDWLRWCGVGSAVSGLALLYWADQCLGQNLSVTLKIREGHTLVTHGPYRWVRHPAYTATLLYSLSMGWITANRLLAAMFFLPMFGLIALRVGREERMMLGQFGDEYRRSMARTGRFLPPCG